MFKQRDNDWGSKPGCIEKDASVLLLVLTVFAAILKHPRYIWRYIHYGEE